MYSLTIDIICSLHIVNAQDCCISNSEQYRCKMLPFCCLLYQKSMVVRNSELQNDAWAFTQFSWSLNERLCLLGNNSAITIRIELAHLIKERQCQLVYINMNLVNLLRFLLGYSCSCLNIHSFEHVI